MNINRFTKLTSKLSTRFSSSSLLKLINQQNKTERYLFTSKTLNTFQADNEEKGRNRFPKPNRWPKRNERIRDPVPIDSLEKPRAVYYHFRDNIKYSPKKMWYICSFVRGLQIDEAIKQLSFITSKGAHMAKEILIEAQEEAIKNGFEYKSDMFVGDCFCTKGLVIKGQRKHAFYRMGEIRYFYSHFYVKLVEGPPPKEYYYDPNPKTGNERINKFIEDMRSRKIEYTL